MSQFRHPVDWIASWRSLPIRIGVFTAAGLIVVMLTAVVVANHTPWLDEFGVLRLSLSYAAFSLVMFIPIGYFWRSPRRLFICGLVAWVLFSLGYAVAGDFYFTNLFNRLSRSPFTMFVQGTVIYGSIAVAAWVGTLLAAARHQPMAYPRRRHY